MPTKARRERETGHATFQHVVGARPAWNANREAVALLLQAFGYPCVPPAPIGTLGLEPCRFHVLP